MFRDTFATHRFDNRDPRVKYEQRPVKDMNHARRSKSRVGHAMVTYADSTIIRTINNYTTQPRPDLKRNLRVETNQTIQNFNRQTQAEVLRLAEADRAGADEQSAISGVCAALQRLLEDVERTLWLVDQSIAKRGTRCLHDDSGVDIQLKSEKKATIAIRKRIKQVYAETTLISKVLMDARAKLKSLLQQKRSVLDVQADVYSGVVTTYPVPVREDPSCLKELSEVYQTSQRRRNESDAFAAESHSLLAQLRANVEEAMKQSDYTSRSQQRDTVLAKGRNRLARNGNARHLHWLEISQKCNEGPYQGANYEKVANKHDRPLVKNYNKQKSKGSKSHVTQFEQSRKPFNTFDRTIACANDDKAQLDMAAVGLEANYHDRTYDKGVNKSIDRFRSTLKPGRRP